MIAPRTAPRLTLGAYQESDGPALAEWLSDRLLLLALYPQSLQPPALAKVLADWRCPPSGLGDWQFAIRLEDQRLIGCVRLERRLLSYFLGRPYWGQGLGGRVLGLVTAGLRDRQPGALVRALVARDNVASCRVLQRNGFIFSGIVPGPPRLRCVHEYVFRVDGPPASLPAEEQKQPAVDRR